MWFGGAGKWPGKCDHCGKEFDGTHLAYSFTIGSPDEHKAKGSIVLGSKCVKRLVPAEAGEEEYMIRVRDVLCEASFPSAGKGMEWGESEQVTPENLAGYVERLKRGEGMFVIATYTRTTWFDAKAWAKWEAIGKPMIKVAKDGKGLFTIEGRKYVYSPPTSPAVRWIPKQKMEEGRMRTVRELAEANMAVAVADALGKCEAALAALDAAQRAFGDVMDVVVRGVQGVPLAPIESKMLVRNMHADMRGVAGAYDRVARLRKGLKAGTLRGE